MTMQKSWRKMMSNINWEQEANKWRKMYQRELEASISIKRVYQEINRDLINLLTSLSNDLRALIPDADPATMDQISAQIDVIVSNALNNPDNHIK